jgi:hypothetical protein
MGTTQTTTGTSQKTTGTSQKTTEAMARQATSPTVFIHQPADMRKRVGVASAVERGR